MLFQGIKINKIKTALELAPLLSLSEDQLKLFLVSKENFIKRGRIMKRDLNFRKIAWVKDDSYRHLQKKITEFLDAFYLPISPDSNHGFVKKRSIVTNAQQHTQKKVVLNIDIKDFFPSVSKIKVVEIFISLGFQEEIAKIFAELLTLDNSLVAGFSTSPVLSNIICISLDKDFEHLAASNNTTYTRYADDITFSSNTELPSLKEINLILNKYDFFINPGKIKIYRRGGPQYVTGLSVVDNKPRLSKRFKRSIRLELFYIKKYKALGHLAHRSRNLLETDVFMSRFSMILLSGYGVEGFVSFINSVEPELAKKMCFILPSNEASVENKLFK